MKAHSRQSQTAATKNHLASWAEGSVGHECLIKADPLLVIAVSSSEFQAMKLGEFLLGPPADIEQFVWAFVHAAEGAFTRSILGWLAME